MRKPLYIHINEAGVFACFGGKTDGAAYAALSFPPGVFGDVAAMTATAEASGTFIKDFALLRRGILPPVYIPVADTLRTVIRMVQLPASGKGLTAKEKWELVKGAFPIGELMNETTHLFDGYKWGTQFFIAALPVGIADVMARFCALLIGGAWKMKRLEAIEHLLFRRLVKEANKPHQWFLFPQQDSLRVLTTSKGLPQTAVSLPTLDEIKNEALFRLWQTQAPEKVTILSRPDWTQIWDKNEEWLRVFLKEKEIICEKRPFISE